jgi:plasmid stabilization system protein ParE
LTLASQVVFHRLAFQEALAAEAWYANRSAEVAERFRDAVGRALQQVVDDVGTHAIDARFRYVRVDRFPYYLIYFHESASTARIVAVSHFRRRPGYWRRRK